MTARYPYLKDNEAATPHGVWSWARRIVEVLNKRDQDIDKIPSGSKVGWHAGAIIPTGWLLADGSSVAKTDYPVLFGVFGYTYGGAGDNFNLPTEADTIIKV